MYLLDTCIIAELAKQHPDPQLLSWIETLPRLVVSAITIEELSYAVKKGEPDQLPRLQAWFEEFMKIPPTVLPINEQVAAKAGAMRAARDLAGRSSTQSDMLIAATASCTGRILVTRNLKPYAHCGVPLFSPFPVRPLT